MYILIDRQKMQVVFRCEKLETIRALCHIECSECSVSILEENCIGALLQFSIKNLQQLFENLTGGTNPHSNSADYLAGQISRLCRTCTPTELQDFEVIVQSLQIKRTDRKCYKYIKGVSMPMEVEENDLQPLTGNWNAAQGLPPTATLTSLQSPVKVPAQGEMYAAVQTTPPKYAPPWA